MTNTMTRKAALSIAYVLLSAANMESYRPDENLKDVDYVEAAEVIGKMIDQLSKPRAKAVSKARKANEYLADKVAELSGDKVTTKDVVALGLPDITTTQKAAAVLRVACERGHFEKITEGKKVTYRKITA